MTESSATLPHRWRYGMHPEAVGLQIASLGRVVLPIGEALRLEMEGSDPGSEDIVRVQYYVATESGGWALWLSCPKEELAAREAALEAMAPVPTSEP